MSRAFKVLLRVLVLCTLVCIGLGANPHAFGGAPLQSTSIRSGQAPDSQCVVVRRILTADASDSTDTRPSLVGLLPSSLAVCPASWRELPPCAAILSGLSSRLVVHGPRARAPPACSVG